MKKMIGLLLFSVVAAGVFHSTQAQRGGVRGDRDRGNRSSNVFPSRSERGSSADRTYRNANSESRNIQGNNFNNYNRAIIASRENGRVNTINSNRIISTNQQRNDLAVRERRYNYTVSQPRTYRENYNVGRIRYPSQNVVQRNVVQRNYNTYNSYNRNYNRGGYYRGGYYYPRHIFMTGPRYTVLP